MPYALIMQTGNAAAGGAMPYGGAPSALALSMTLHELATNATKYVALSNEAGAVSVSWAMVASAEVSGEASPHLALRWEERDGTAVTIPTRRGFGTRMIERGLASDLVGAKCEFSTNLKG